MSKLDQLERLNWRDFEHLCLVLLEHHFNAPDANFYSANSFGQNGIDIRLTTTKGDMPARVVIQCKAYRSLDWSDFSGDLRQALMTFARKTIKEGRAFTFILATTAEIENTKKFDPQKDQLVEEVGLGDIAKQIHFHVFTGARIRAMVEHDPKLRDLVDRPKRLADLSLSQELIRLGAELTRHAEGPQIASAQAAFEAYLQSADLSSPEKFDWVPTPMFDQLARLKMDAGDFEQVNKILNAALGSDPLNARYQLGYLRARRVLHAAPRHDLQRAHPLDRPVVIPAPEDDVAVMAPQLLTALGDTDRQLTLALWMVSYARKQELGEQGLKRALGLVTQAWPIGVGRLEKDASYLLSSEGYLDRLSASPALWRPPASNDQLKACALAAGYTYIRWVHETRFGFDSVRRAEEAHQGWPASIEGICLGNATSYFSDLQPLSHRALRTNLPALLFEGRAREYGNERSDRFLNIGRIKLESSTYAATPEFLLRDCEKGVVQRRVEEFAQGDLMGYGVTILISHLGLERLVQVQLGERLGVNSERTPDQQSAMADAITGILNSVIRSESAHGIRWARPRPPFVSSACYADFAAVEHINPRGASIELARNLKLPFMGASALEWNLAKAELLPADRHLLYWKPATSPFQT